MARWASGWLWIVLAIAMAIVLANGCAGDSTPEVVVYVAVDRQQAEPVLKQFEAESGIRVLPLYDAEAAKTTGLVTRLLAESRRPNCDVFWNNEMVQTMMLAERGLLQAYESPAADGIPAAWRDDQRQWTGVATRARVIVYNTRYVKPEEAPRRLSDLTDPRWRGRVAVANPQFGTTRTHIAALYAAWGPEPTQQFLRDLLENEVRIVDGNAMVKNLVARADPDASPIYVGLTDTDDVLAGQAAGEPVAMILPDQGEGESGTLVVGSTVAMIRDAPRAESARRLIDYLLNAEVGRRFATPESGYRPVREAGSADGGIRALEIELPALLDQLEPSSQWTAKHFPPRG
ncbi:MAG: extracellular solute-binding protein [Planctomycetales bacterium]|nr:extracellular solute-binding protein [Planctomycetales bacterium]